MLPTLFSLFYPTKGVHPIYDADLILLDFSKTFDTVPHRHPLAKLQYYKINNAVGIDPIMAH